MKTGTDGGAAPPGAVDFNRHVFGKADAPIAVQRVVPFSLCPVGLLLARGMGVTAAGTERACVSARLRSPEGVVYGRYGPVYDWSMLTDGPCLGGTEEWEGFRPNIGLATLLRLLEAPSHGSVRLVRSDGTVLRRDGDAWVGRGVVVMDGRIFAGGRTVKVANTREDFAVIRRGHSVLAPPRPADVKVEVGCGLQVAGVTPRLTVLSTVVTDLRPALLLWMYCPSAPPAPPDVSTPESWAMRGGMYYLGCGADVVVCTLPTVMLSTPGASALGGAPREPGSMAKATGSAPRMDVAVADRPGKPMTACDKTGYVAPLPDSAGVYRECSLGDARRVLAAGGRPVVPDSLVSGDELVAFAHYVVGVALGAQSGRRRDLRMWVTVCADPSCGSWSPDDPRRRCDNAFGVFASHGDAMRVARHLCTTLACNDSVASDWSSYLHASRSKPWGL